MTWLNDSLEKYMDLCDAICIEGNSGNYVYKHLVDTNVILELRTTCGDIIRRFYDCSGTLLYSCTSFDFTSSADCDLPFLPSPDDGEILWTCTTTSTYTNSTGRNAFRFYPTFITDQVTLETEKPQIGQITVYNILGQVIEMINSHSTKEIISASDWPHGTIFIKVRSHEIEKIIKLIKVD
jgi:hypothetical protein